MVVTLPSKSEYTTVLLLINYALNVNEISKMVEKKETERAGEKLWEYRLHEDNVLYQRMNFFLVAESMLLVAYATLFSASHPNMLVMRLIGTLGIFLTLIWSFANLGQMRVIEQITKEAESVISIYARIRRERSKWPVMSTRLLVHLVPLVVLITWLALILLV